MAPSALFYEKGARWFHEAHFGMFIHWGVYALSRRGECVMYHKCMEDLDAPEQHLKASAPSRACELCMTIDSCWWRYCEHTVSWRTVPQLIGYLVGAASGTGNLLFNVGPLPDGTLRPQHVQRLRAVGLRRNGDAV